MTLREETVCIDIILDISPRAYVVLLLKQPQTVFKLFANKDTLNEKKNILVSLS